MQPVPLQEWASGQMPHDDMLWKGAWGRQILFARDKLQGLVGVGLSYEQRQQKPIATVISTHTSKSIVLPVYSMERPDLGLRLVLRDNFYDWKLSVISEKPIVADFSGLFHTTSPVEPEYTGNELSHVYFEGFPRELVFGYFGESDGCRWSASISTDEACWMTVFLIMRAIGAIRPLKWHTRESHRAELEAESAARKADRK